MTEVGEYLETQRALDKNGKPDESVLGIKMYKSLKVAKVANKLFTRFRLLSSEWGY